MQFGGAHPNRPGRLRLVFYLALLAAPCWAGVVTNRWRGQTDCQWDVGVSSNWSANTNLWRDGDVAYFDATYVTNHDVVIVGAVRPASVVFYHWLHPYSLSGGDIAGDGDVDVTWDTQLTIRQPSLSFTGGMTIRHKGAKVWFRPSGTGPHALGVGVIRIGETNYVNPAYSGGQFFYAPVDGGILPNDFVVGPYGATMMGRGYSGKASLRGVVTVPGGIANSNLVNEFDADIVVSPDGNVLQLSWCSRYCGRVLSPEGEGPYDVEIRTATGAVNEDHRAHLAGAGTWNVRNVRKTGFSWLILECEEPAFLSNITGKVIVESGAVRRYVDGKGVINITMPCEVWRVPYVKGTSVMGRVEASWINVKRGGCVAGDGLLKGTVVVEDGTLAPGRPSGTLVVTGDVSLAAQSTLEYELGAASGTDDLISVTGNVRLDGVLNVADRGELTNGVYPLITYSGKLIGGRTVALGRMPAGHDYAVLTNSPGVVALRVRQGSIRGSDGAGVTKDFQMGLTEVTAAQFVEFLNAQTNGELGVTDGVVRLLATTNVLCITAEADARASVIWRPAELPGARFVAQAGRETHPMVFVSWFGAAAYCNWRSLSERMECVYEPTNGWRARADSNGYRLPWEAEWCKAAAWDVTSRAYRVYGTGRDSISSNDCNLLCSGDSWETNDVPTSPVGSYATSSPYGLKDASGNVWEWCQDFYGPYGSRPLVDPRAVRGGGWGSLLADVKATSRAGNKPWQTLDGVGFRILRTNLEK